MSVNRFALWFVPVLAVVVSLLPATPAAAAAGTWVEPSDATRVRLVSATEGMGANATARLGLHFELGDGWKIYWRAPGDAGYPPRVDWSGSDNLASARLSWPAPERFSILGLETMGYKDEVVLPLDVEARDPSRPLELRGRLEYLTCSDICIPAETDIALTLPAGPADPSAEAHLINRFASLVPPPQDALAPDARPLEVTAAGVGTGPDGAPVLQVTARARDGFADPDLFIEGPQSMVFGVPRAEIGAAGTEARFILPADTRFAEEPLAGAKVTVTLIDGGRAVEHGVPVSDGPLSAPGGMASADVAVGGASLLAILGLAWLGGLILNLMPCVLPVLSIKLLGVVKHGGGEHRQVRGSFLASAAGILASFMLLAGVLIAAKAAGAAVGWGIQFQQPWFLISMSVLVTLFAANLWGFFEVHLPGAVAHAGDRAAHVNGLGGHFLTGMLATLLATPCSAPFLGTAVGFAFAAGPGEILLVFIALGIGLATPYLVVAAAPGLATRLPRPGTWMVVLRRVLGFALAATAVWLLWVLSAQVGTTASLALAALLTAMITLLALHRRLGRRTLAGGLAALVVAAFLVPVGLAPDRRAAGVVEGGGRDAIRAVAAGLWTPLEREAIAGHVARGRVVFVDVTADWCITCAVNKELVLYRDEVLAKLRAPSVVAMQGDWTNPDPQISDYLASFGRYGIPFNAVYGPAVPEGIALPELLTREAVLSAIVRAGGGVTADADSGTDGG